MIRRLLIVTLGFVLLGSAAVVTAQSYPTRPVRILVPWPAGGSIDAAGRIAAQRLSSALGASLVVDNRAGAAGTIGVLISSLNRRRTVIR
jgi:tripartite-type tricarboxylate transporter receptor subunit TctC